jgi:hypothetical protein
MNARLCGCPIHAVYSVLSSLEHFLAELAVLWRVFGRLTSRTRVAVPYLLRRANIRTLCAHQAPLTHAKRELSLPCTLCHILSAKLAVRAFCAAGLHISGTMLKASTAMRAAASVHKMVPALARLPSLTVATAAFRVSPMTTFAAPCFAPGEPGGQHLLAAAVPSGAAAYHTRAGVAPAAFVANPFPRLPLPSQRCLGMCAWPPLWMRPLRRTWPVSGATKPPPSCMICSAQIARALRLWLCGPSAAPVPRPLVSRCHAAPVPPAPDTLLPCRLCLTLRPFP